MRDQLSSDEWLVQESGFDPARANAVETRFTVGNGRLGTRGTLEEGHRGELSGTYLNGVYDGHDSAVTDLVNAPDWLWLAVYVDGVRLDVQSCTALEHERVLDLRRGVLHRRTVFVDGQGRRTRLETARFASLADRDLCAMRAEITPENHGSVVTVESGIDGRRRNLDREPVYLDAKPFHPEVRWEKWTRARHIEEVARSSGPEGIYLQVRTIDSEYQLGYAAAIRSSRQPVHRTVREGYEWIAEQADFALGVGETLQVDKLVSIATSRDHLGGAGVDPAGADREAVRDRSLAALAAHRGAGFDRRLADSVAVWDRLWADCDCEIVGDPAATRALRFGIYHLLIAANGDDPTVNIGAKSLSGEFYKGHVFWDTEIFLLPFFTFTQPGVARNLMRYRHHTLPGARAVAAEGGLRGARYPWESADTGREECPIWTTDGANRFWTRDEEIHVSADVAFGVLSYVLASGDTDFLHSYGAEIVFETSRFWVDRAEYDEDRDRYAYRKVMGPDEFHSHVDDNAFTNHLARWHLYQAVWIHDELAAEHPEVLARIAARIGLEPVEADRWHRVADKIDYPVDEGGLIEQFEGYFQRKDVPIAEWDAHGMPRYPEGYHHFNLEDTMLLKQPDSVMLTYMFPDDFSLEVKRANFEFYEHRTLHKSSLSPAIHAIIGLEVEDRTRAMQYFRRSAFVDLDDNQGNTEQGMHIASAGGTWQILVNGFGGFRVRHGQMTFTPWLPEEWEEIRFRLRWLGDAIAVTIGHTEATFRLDADAGASYDILVHGEPVTLTANTTTPVSLATT